MQTDNFADQAIFFSKIKSVNIVVRGNNARHSRFKWHKALRNKSREIFCINFRLHLSEQVD